MEIKDSKLPDLAFDIRVHVAASRAGEGRRKEVEVHERAEHAEARWRVHILEDGKALVLGSGLGAPTLRVANEKERVVGRGASLRRVRVVCIQNAAVVCE